MGGDGIAQSAEMTASCPAAFPSGTGFLPEHPVRTGFTVCRRTIERPTALRAVGCAANLPGQDPVPPEPAAPERRRRKSLSRFQFLNAQKSALRTPKPGLSESLQGLRPVSEGVRHSSGGSRRGISPDFKTRVDQGRCGAVYRESAGTTTPVTWPFACL